MNETRIATTPGQKMSLSAAFATPQFQNAIHNALNDAAREKSFVASVIAASTASPVIKECTPQSVLSAALIGESLRLCPSPQLGHYYFVPYESKIKDGNGKDVVDERGKPIKRKEAQFQMGYKGYIQLALRSGEYKKLNVISIKKGELKRWDALNEEIEVKLIEDEDERELAETVGYYATFESLNGFRKAIYWSKAKMERHALRYSQGYRSDKKNGTAYTFWSKDFDGMAYKTMLRQIISKWGIMSLEMQTAFQNDSADIIQDDQGNNIIVNDIDDAPIPERYNDMPIVEAEEDKPEPPAPDRPKPANTENQVSLDDL